MINVNSDLVRWCEVKRFYLISYWLVSCIVIIDMSDTRKLRLRMSSSARDRKKNEYIKIIICLALEITSHIIFLIYLNFQER